MRGPFGACIDQVAAVYGRLIEVLATMLGPPMEQVRTALPEGHRAGS